MLSTARLEMKMIGEVITGSMPPSEEEQIQELGRMLRLGPPTLLGPANERVELPDSVYNILKDVVRHMAAGNAVALVPQKQHLTTQMAANLLGFSRPHLIKLLESGAMPYEKVGQHRRLRLRDVLAFQRQRDKVRKHALDGLARETFQAGHYEGTAILKGDSDE